MICNYACVFCNYLIQEFHGKSPEINGKCIFEDLRESDISLLWKQGLEYESRKVKG